VIKPNYIDGSTVNLVSSIGKSFGCKIGYKPLKILNQSDLKGQSVMLIVVDGMGYDFLRKHGGKEMIKNLKGKITSVFPSSTSAAITALMTGMSTKEHGSTGWYMNCKEFGSVIIPLPYVSRHDWSSSLSDKIDMKKIFDIRSFADRIKQKSYLIQKREILDTEFSIAAAGRSKRIGYDNMDGFFREMKKVIKKKGRKFIFVYYPEHDSMCHDYGSESKKVIAHFKKFEKKLNIFLKSIGGSNTTAIITADHGMIEVPKNKRVDLKDHPKLRDTLSAPLCGEHRFAYCYVKSNKKNEFERYVRTKLKKYCWMYKSENLVKKGLFGLNKAHPKLLDRIGDYTLIMKENYGISEPFMRQKKASFNLGDHGGVSREEMYIPIIVSKG
jgi:hypothetical protein